MRLLLDTHTFIWWDSAPEKLSSRVLELCQDDNNVLLLSVVSVWEMQIKSRIGKLTLNRSLETLISEQQETNQIKILSIELPHVLELQNLTDHHRDPFDRLLIAQTKIEGVSLLSKDAVFAKYTVDVIW